ncbi:MAG: diguanylate cyclase, partial [Anaerolineaceae bacterium]|nr:diguanylate cyclase [Anaerolineaceae bacterium]
NFYIALYDPSSDTLSFPFFIDEYEKSAPPIKLGRGLTGYVIRTGRSLLITQELFDQLVKEGELELIGAKSVDWLGVPLMVKGQIIGAMATQSYNERTHYSQDDADLMQFVSTQVALAIERKHSEEALSKSEAELRALFAAMTDVILVLDLNGRYLKIAPTNPNLLYKTPDKMLGKTLHEVLPKEQADRFLKEIHASLANKKTRQFEYALSIAERTSWFSCSISPMSEDAIVWVARDITERKLAEETLRKSETRYRNLFEDSPISLWEEDFSAVRQYLDGLRRNGVNDFKEYFESHPEEINRCVSMIKVLDVNKAAVKMAHAPDKSRLIGSMDQLFGSKIPVDFIQELVSVAEGKTEFDWEGVNYRLDGEQLVVSMRWSAAPGYEETLSKVLLSFTDITEQVHVQETLRSLSLTDDLTGLYNRRGFTLLAEQQMRLAHRVNIKILMFYGDVNDLKLINDTFGHTEGDQALIDTAAVLRSTFREADIIARIGGDEFVVLALDSSGDSCELLEERFHQALQDFNQCGNHLFNISVSFSGVSYDPETPISLNDLIKLADQKMYVQKQTWHRLNKTSRGGPSRSLWHHK